MSIPEEIYITCLILGTLLVVFAILAFIADEFVGPWIERRRLARLRREMDEAYDEATKRG